MNKVWRVKITDHQYNMLSNAVCHMEYTDREEGPMFGEEIKALNRLLRECRDAKENL